MATDLTVRFSGDTSQLSSSIALAKQTLAQFAPQGTAAAVTGLSALTAALVQARTRSDESRMSFLQMTGAVAIGNLAAEAIKGATSAYASYAETVFKAGYSTAEFIRNVEIAPIVAEYNAIKALDVAILGLGDTTAYAERSTRLFAQANEGVIASIRRVVVDAQNYVAAAQLLSQGTVQMQMAALAAAGNFDRFSDAVDKGYERFGSVTDTLTHFTSELAKIPGMTAEAATGIESMIAAMPVMDTKTNDLVIQWLQQTSKSAEEARENVAKLTASLTAGNANGGTQAANLILKQVDFTNLDEAKGKLVDLLTLSKNLGASFADSAQTKAFFDTLINKANQANNAAMQPLIDKLKAFESLGPVFGGLLELGLEKTVDKQIQFNTELTNGLRLMQQQAEAAVAVTKAIERQSDYQKLINADSTRSGRETTANENIKLLNDPTASQGRSNADASVGSDRDLLIRTMIGEAGGEGAAGMEAVANVIKNRVESAFDGMKTYRDVILEGNGKQFNTWAPWNAAGARASSLDPDSAEYKRAAAIVDKLAAGNLDDNTNGATSFYNPTTAAKPFAMSNVTTIGNQRYGNTAGSPPVRGDDEDDQRNERMSQQLALLKQIKDEKAGGSVVDLADAKIAQENAAGLHDQVAQAKELLKARESELEAAKAVGDPKGTLTAQKAVSDARIALNDKEAAVEKANNDLNVAAAQAGSKQKLDAQLAGFDAEIARARGNGAAIAGIEKQKIEAVRSYNQSLAADAAADENAKFDAVQRSAKQEQEQIRENAQLDHITREQEVAQLADSLSRQEAATRAHYGKLAAIQAQYGADTAQAVRKNELQAADAQNRIDAERVATTRSVNTAIEQSYRSSFEEVGQTVSSTLMQMIQRQATLRDLARNVALNIIQQFIQARIRMVADWAAGQAAQVAQTVTAESAKTGATAAGTAARTSLIGTASLMQAATVGVGIVKSIIASAAETFAGIFGFLSPIMGPAAVGPAAAGQAAVASVASLASFDVGTWSLPSSGLAMVHAGEMIVPAAQTPWAQSLMAAAGSNSTTMGDTNVHIHPQPHHSSRDIAEMVVKEARRIGRGLATRTK